MPSRSSQYREARHFQRTILRPLSPSAGLRTARPMCADRVGPRALRGTAGRRERHPRPHQPRRSACLVAHSLHHLVRHQPARLRVVRGGDGRPQGAYGSLPGLFGYASDQPRSNTRNLPARRQLRRPRSTSIAPPRLSRGRLLVVVAQAGARLLESGEQEARLAAVEAALGPRLIDAAARQRKGRR